MSDASVPDVASAGEPRTFVCPECGRTFAEAKALGSHRRAAHKVVGQSKSAERARLKREALPNGGRPVFAKEAQGPRVYPWQERITSEPKPRLGKRSLRLEEMLSPKPLKGDYEFSFSTRLDRDQALALGAKLEAILEEMLSVKPTVSISIIG